ncbi:hypothetical protein, partial [Ferruginibacter sp.]
FSTGLKHSGRRPLRLLAMGQDRVSAIQLARHHGIATFDLAEARTGGTLPPTRGWAGFVAAALVGGRLPLLSAEIGDEQPKHSLVELDSRGDTLLQQLGSVGENAVGPAGSAQTTEVRSSVEPEYPIVLKLFQCCLMKKEEQCMTLLQKLW